MLQDTEARMERLKTEHQNEMDREFEVAYSKLRQEQEKNKNLSLEAHKQAEERFKQGYQFVIEKLDDYVHNHTAELMVEARRNVMSDPRILEHKLALDQILDIAASYMGEAGIGAASATKVKELSRKLKEMESHVQVLEHRNIRLSQRNSTLTEQVNKSKAVLNEQHKVERKEKARIANESASGRGHRVLTDGKIIPEYSAKKTESVDDGSEVFNEQTYIEDMMVLSGLKDEPING